MIQGLDIATVQALEKSGFLKPSLEPYIHYHRKFKEAMVKYNNQIEIALEATGDECGAHPETVRRAVNKISLLFKLAQPKEMTQPTSQG